MADAGENGDSFVPTSFEDLRRDTRANRPDVPLAERRQTSRDLHDLVSQNGFMKNSGMIAAGAATIGAVLILAAYFHPLLDTFDAFHTAGQVAADKAGQQIHAVQGTVGGLADKAAFVKDTDMKAINTAKGGLACLTGHSSCPSTSSPFK